MSETNVAADLRLCEQRVLQLNAFQTRFVAGLLAKGIVAEDEARTLAEIAAELRITNIDEPEAILSADVVLLSPRK